jgi:elongation factor G
MSGEVSVGMELTNEKTNTVERIGQLFIMDGKNRNSIDKLKAGDIGSTLKLKNTATNHTLNGKGAKGNVDPIHFPGSKVRTAVVTRNKNDDEKIGEVLQEIHAEDPTILIEYDKELKQLLLHGQGELHLSVTKWRINHIYKLDIEFVKPRIPYRETIQRSALASYKHKKQSGGAGQFGEVYLKIEPYYEGMPAIKEYTVRDTEVHDLAWGGKLVFNNCITGGVIDSRFIPSIIKGVMEKLTEGPLTGSYVRDVRVSVYDGKMHPVDSNDLSFKIAGMMAFRDAFLQAEPQLLEPIYEVETELPEAMMGEVMSELQTRRSMITGMENKNGFQVIKAKTPLAEIDKYNQSLRSITQGRGRVAIRFSDYAPVPMDVQKRLSEDYKKQEVEH